MTNDEKPFKAERTSKERSFVAWAIERCANDSGFAANLSRADNPSTQHRSWPALAGFGVDLENPYQREPYAIVAAYLAKRRKDKIQTGGHTLGKAMLLSYDNKSDSPAAQARMRRILAASDTIELCRLLRPTLSLISSRGVALDMGLLLENIMWFEKHPTRIKSRWAQDFYKPQKDTDKKKKGAVV